MFYTYAHKKPNGEIFYIGKGSLKRAYAYDNRNSYWKNIVAKYGLIVDILSTWSDEQEAISHEKLLIACLKDMGIKLCNITNGGEGVSGLKHTKETKEKLSAFQKIFQNTEKMKLVRKKNAENYRNNFERRVKQSKKIKQYMENPENREKSRIGAKKLAANPAFIAAQRKRAIDRMKDPNIRYLMATPCICVETGQIFKSQADAAKFINGRPQTISRAVSGKRKTAYGFHWKSV